MGVSCVAWVNSPMKSPAGTSEISTTGGEHGFLNTLGKATLSSRPTSGKVSHAALLSESISHQQNEACEKNQPLPVLVLCPCDKKPHRRSVLRKGLLVLVWCFWWGEEAGGGTQGRGWRSRKQNQRCPSHLACFFSPYSIWVLDLWNCEA